MQAVEVYYKVISLRTYSGYNCAARKYVQRLSGLLYGSNTEFQCLKHALSAWPHTSDHLNFVTGVGWMQWLVLLILIS